MANELEQWELLVTELDYELTIFTPIRHQLGKVFYEMKIHLHNHGLDKGRGGRWAKALRERKIAESTARDWVVNYQRKENIPLAKCFYPLETSRIRKARKSAKNRQNNTADTAPLANLTRVECADDKDPKNRDSSPEKRLAVECVFVLTLAQKAKFMQGVTKLGPGPSTQIMCEAVIQAAKGKV
jgi:hypothetical protein